MQGKGAVEVSMQALTDKELEDGLALLRESQAFLQAILFGVALQYHSLDLEREKLLGQSAGADPQTLQMIASLVTLGALFGFQNQAECLADQKASAGETPDMMDVKLGATSILVTMIRLFRLLGERWEPQSQANSLSQVEGLDGPVI